MKTDKQKLKDQLLKQYGAQLDEMIGKLDDSKPDHLMKPTPRLAILSTINDGCNINPVALKAILLGQV